MTIRELIVKVSASLDRASFDRASQAANGVKQGLEQVSRQGHGLRGVMQGLSHDFSGLTEALRRHSAVLMGLGAGLTAIVGLTARAAFSFEELDFQLRRIAGTDEEFANLKAQIESVQKATEAFTTRELMEAVKFAADDAGLSIEKVKALLPDIAKVAAAQGDRIEEFLGSIRQIAAGGDIRPKIAALLGAEEVARLRQAFREVDEQGKKLNLTVEELAARKFSLVLESLAVAAKSIEQPVTKSRAAFTAFRETLDQLQREVGAEVLPQIIPLIQMLSGLMRTIAGIPGAVQALATAMVVLAAKFVIAGILGGVIRTFLAFKDVVLGLSSAVRNLGVRLAFLLHAAGFQGAAFRLAQGFGLAAREGGLLAAMSVRLRAGLSSLRNAVIAVMAAWRTAGAAGIASLMGTGAAAAAAATGARLLTGAIVGAKVALTALAFAGRGLLKLLGPIALVFAAVQGLIWLFDKLWGKISGREAAEKAARFFRERAVSILEQSEAAIKAQFAAMGEAGREAAEEAFAKLPVELQMAAAQIGAEAFLKINVDSEPIKKLVSEIRKGRIEGEAVAAELNKIIVRAKDLRGLRAQVSIEEAKAHLRALAEMGALRRMLGIELQLRGEKLPEELEEALERLGPHAKLFIQMKFAANPGWVRDFARRIREQKMTVEQVVQELTQAIADYLPKSPAKRGPLTRLNEVGPGFARTIAASLRSVRHVLEAAFADALPALRTVRAGVRFVAEKFDPLAPELPELVQRVRRDMELVEHEALAPYDALQLPRVPAAVQRHGTVSISLNFAPQFSFSGVALRSERDLWSTIESKLRVFVKEGVIDTMVEALRGAVEMRPADEPGRAI